MSLVATKTSTRSSRISAPPRNLSSRASSSQANRRNQVSIPSANSNVIEWITTTSPIRAHINNTQLNPSSSPQTRTSSSPSASGGPLLTGNYSLNSIPHGGQTAPLASQPGLTPTTTSTSLFSRTLKWSMDTKVSIFSTVCAVLGLVISIIFSVYALKCGNAANGVSDRSLAISMWQACVQFPNSPSTLTSKWCQENMNKSLEDLDARSVGDARPKFVLEPDLIPSWITIPDELDKSTCYMTCEGRKSSGVGIEDSAMFERPSAEKRAFSIMVAALTLGLISNTHSHNWVFGILSAFGGIIYVLDEAKHIRLREANNRENSIPSCDSDRYSCVVDNNNCTEYGA